MATTSLIDSTFLETLETLDLYIKNVMNGRFGGARRSALYGSSAEFADYREYMPGDDPRRIDWNLAARLDKHYIRQFVDERQMKNVVYLDLSASMGLDTGKARMALCMAAAMGYLSVQNLDHVAFRLLQGDACCNLCGTVVGREAFYAATQELAGYTFAGEVDLYHSIHNDPDPGHGNGMSILISDFLTESDWKRAVDELLARHREVALIQVLSPEEVEPVYHGRLLLRDSEAMSVEDRRHLRLSADRSAALAYRDAVEYFMWDIHQFCLSRGIAFMSVRSDENIEHVILEKGFKTGLIK